MLTKLLMVICLLTCFLSCSINTSSEHATETTIVFQGESYTSFTNYQNETSRVYLRGRKFPSGIQDSSDKIAILLINNIIKGSMFYTCDDWMMKRLQKAKTHKTDNYVDFDIDRLNFLKNNYGNTCEIFNIRELSKNNKSETIEKFEFFVSLDRQPGDPTAFEFEIEIEIDYEEDDFMKKYSNAKLISFKRTNLML